MKRSVCLVSLLAALAFGQVDIPKEYRFAGHEPLAPPHSLARPLDGPVVALIPGKPNEAYVFESGTGRFFHLNYSDFRLTGIALRPSLTDDSRTAGFAVDREGNAYLPLGERNHVWRISPDGTARVFAGNGTRGTTGDGSPATDAQLDEPVSTSIDESGNVYILQRSVIRRVDRQGRIGFYARSSARQMTIDKRGNLYTTDGRDLWVVNRGGVTVRIPRVFDPTMPLREPSRFAFTGLAVEPGGLLVLADAVRRVVWRMMPSGFLAPWVGNSTFGAERISDGYLGNGPLTGSEHFGSLGSLAVDEQGRVLIADQGFDALRLFTPGDSLVTVAGRRLCCYGEDGMLATQASFRWPRGLATDQQGNIYVADPAAGYVRKIDTAGRITNILGNGGLAFRSGVPALQTGAQPYSVAVDSKGNVYVSEPQLGLIRVVTPNGIVELIDGPQTGTFPVELVRWPRGGAVAVGPDDSLYYLTPNNIFRWSPTTGRKEPLLKGETGPYRDGGLANESPASGLMVLTVAQDGTVYFAGPRQNIRFVRDGRLNPLPLTFPIGTLGLPTTLLSGPDSLLYITDYYDQGLPIPINYRMAYARDVTTPFPISSNYTIAITREIAPGLGEIVRFDREQKPFVTDELNGLIVAPDGRVIVSTISPPWLLVYPKVETKR